MRAHRITQVLKEHDPELFCLNQDGLLSVYRRGTRIESYEVDGVEIDFVRSSPHFVFSLTDDWKKTGRPVDWGLIPIINRLNAIDLWSRDLATDLEKEYIKAEESKHRDVRNSIESFLYDYRSQFKKTFADVNTANMAKKSRQREIENGNRK